MTADATLTVDLLKRLERHYIKPGEPLPGGIFVPEVGWNGSTNNSRCDALYIGFTGSSGRLLVGHEVKVSRTDWRRELDKPGKADAWADQCHAWYVVAPSTTIVPVEELPDGWGLLTLAARGSVRLNVAVKATVHRDRQPSWDAVRSIFSRADTLRAAAISDARQKAQSDLYAEVEKRVNERMERERALQPQQRLDELSERLRLIQEALGFTVDTRDDVAWSREGTAALDELRAASAFLTAHINVARAAREIRGRYGRPLDEVRRRLTALDSALGALHELTTTAEEATA